MGAQLLKEPVTTKQNQDGTTKIGLRYGICSMQGWRKNMEDKEIAIDLTDQISLFAVFDGHNGIKVADYCKKQLPAEILKSGSFKKGNYKECLKEVLLKIDSQLEQETEEVMNEDLNTEIKNPYLIQGSTAVVALVTKQTIYVANVGDSRCVISIQNKAKDLSVDHDLKQPSEIERIKKAGGFVENGRINRTGIAMSRALGDFKFKAQKNLPIEAQLVTAVADLVEQPIEKESQFLILACDGIWNVLTSQQAVDELINQFKIHQEQNKSDYLISECIGNIFDKIIMKKLGDEYGSKDNCTCIVIFLNNYQYKQ